MKSCKRCGERFEPEWLDGIKRFSSNCQTCMVRNLFDAMELTTPPELLDKHTTKPALTEQEFKDKIKKRLK